MLVAVGPETTVIAAQAVYDREELVAQKSVEPLSPEEGKATPASARISRRFGPRDGLLQPQPPEVEGVRGLAPGSVMTVGTR